MPTFRCDGVNVDVKNHELVVYDNVDNVEYVYSVTIETLKSVIDGEGVYVETDILQNYTELLRQQQKYASKVLMIDSLLVWDIFMNLHKKGEVTTKVYSETELSTVIENSRSPTALVFLQDNQSVILIPIYHRDHWLLAVIFPKTDQIYFLDTLKNDERTLFYTEAIPVFLKSHLKITPKESWKYEWVLKKSKQWLIVVYLYVHSCTLLPKWNTEIANGIEL